MSTLEVTLTSGEVALVDEADFYLVSGRRWYLNRREDGRRYAKAAIRHPETGRQTYVLMHRLIAGARPGQVVDHVNHDGLDNRRANLRVCSASQNGANRNLAVHKNPTGYIGVWKRRGRYTARVMKDYKRIYAGTFDTPEEAARARDRAARQHFDEFAVLNFPEEEGAA